MPEAFCPSCGKKTLMIVEPVYEGFTRIGERPRCAVCRHALPMTPSDAKASGPAAAPASRKLPSIFSEEDRSPEIHLFNAGENERLCRYCRHYTVNPFRQWCGLHRRDVEATDTCDRFEKKVEKPPVV